MISGHFGRLGCFPASSVIATPGGKRLVWRGGAAVQRSGEQVGALQWASESLAVTQPHTGTGLSQAPMGAVAQDCPCPPFILASSPPP